MNERYFLAPANKPNYWFFYKKEKGAQKGDVCSYLLSRARMIANSCYLIIEEKCHVYISIEDQLQKHLLKTNHWQLKKINIWR